MADSRDTRAEGASGPTRGRAASAGLRRRLREWFRPPRSLRPTRAGWYFFLITFGVGFAALNTGNNLLYLVLSLMLSFLVLSGLLSEWALRGIHVRRQLPRELYAGEDNTIHLVVENRQRRGSSFAIVVEDRAFDDLADSAWRSARDAEPVGRVFAFRVPAGGSETRRYALRPAGRGPLAFAGFQVSTRFPFGLFLKSLIIEATGDVLVFPAIRAASPATPASATSLGEDHGDPHSTSGSQVTGVREYGPGDPVRRVHWRTSIRRRALYVRETESDSDADVEVRLRTGRGPVQDSEFFEHDVSRAASEIVVLLERGARVGLRTDSRRFEADTGHRHRRQLLRYLARVQPDAPQRQQSVAS